VISWTVGVIWPHNDPGVEGTGLVQSSYRSLEVLEFYVSSP